MRTTITLIFLLPASVLAQTQTNQEQEKTFSHVPKEIVFQNDSQWEDNRWQQTDVGPFLAGSITTGNAQTLKGIAIRVGEKGEAAVCFDTARMRISSAWTGDFLKFEAKRFGLIRPPAAAGKVFFSTSKLAGWANEDRFRPNPDEIAGGIENPGKRETRLPKEWTLYKGLYTSGNRVVLSYTVGECDVLESPWYLVEGDKNAFIRSFEIGPSKKQHRVLIADSDCHVEIIGDESAKVEKDGKIFVLTVPARDNTIRVKVLIANEGMEDKAAASLREKAGAPEDLSNMIKSDPSRWPEVLVTQGETTETGGPYVIDTITLPFDNPWNALFFTAGHDFFSNGTAAICTVHGDVWTVTGIDRKIQQLEWRRFATGLHQPLGLKLVDDKVHVVGRNQVTRLHGRNGDGEADCYENFNNDMVVTARTHDFVTCLDTDPEGNFYFIHATTGVMKLSADGSKLTSLADGFRNPNGMGVSPNGSVTAAPQQGGWTPESSSRTFVIACDVNRIIGLCSIHLGTISRQE